MINRRSATETADFWVRQAVEGEWVHLLTIPSTRYAIFERCPPKIFRYALSCILGGKGKLSTSNEYLVEVNYSSKETGNYYYYVNEGGMYWSQIAGKALFSQRLSRQ